MHTLYKNYLIPARWGTPPSTLQTCLTHIAGQTCGFKETMRSRSMRNLSTTAGMWRSCAVNSPLTSKPTGNPRLRKFSPSSKPTAYVCFLITSPKQEILRTTDFWHPRTCLMISVVLQYSPTNHLPQCLAHGTSLITYFASFHTKF